MSFNWSRYNLYLPVLLALALVCGCASHKKKKDEQVGILRFHIQVSDHSGLGSQTVSILRDTPISITIGSEPILSELNIARAALVESPGGFAVEVKFDEVGSWTLEQFTSANPGKHLAIFGQWSDQTKDGRWLAVPLITQRIADGIFAFTPDMSRDEAKKLVLGLNANAKKNKIGQ